MSVARHLRIFLCAPGDVADERGLALQVIEGLRADPLLQGQIEVVTWDQARAAALTPKEAAERGLSGPSACDGVFIIVWGRAGAPLPTEYRKPDGSPYRSITEWVYQDAISAPHPQVIVYRRSEAIRLTPSDPDFLSKYEAWQQVQTLTPCKPYQTPEQFRAAFENDLRALIGRGQAPEPARPSAAWLGWPYPGLRAFLPEDAPLFFGRERETDDLVARLGEPFTCVVGAPGVGKSSLIGAGLLNRLMHDAVEGGTDWPWLRFTPGSSPFLALADVLARRFPTFRARDSRELAAALASEPMAPIAEALRDSPTWAALLLFIDQFEELFTLTAAPERAAFVAFLEEAAETERLRVVAALRPDFYPACLDYPGLAGLLRRGSYPLAAPDGRALRSMITRPAARAGLEFETGLVDQILADTDDLPSLAYLLNRLAPDGTVLTHGTYAALGGVGGAIASGAGAALAGLDDGALPSLFEALVQVDEAGTATCRRAALDSLTEDGLRLAEVLSEAGLLVAREDEGPAVELAHESLLHTWPDLAAWLDEVQDDLVLLRQVRKAAAQWERSGRDASLLWAQERLLPVYVMDDRRQPALDESVQAFIKPEFERLLDELEDSRTTHARRVAIGNRFATLGDIRPGVGLRSDGLPEIAWCAVPGASITLERVPGVFEVRPLRIALYPVTYIQYRAFLEAPDGYTDERWWDGLQHIFDPGEQTRTVANLPAERVSWYDAVAFCRWLTAKYWGLAPGEPSEIVIRLPTEWEWQAAATSGDPANRYPWGADWDSSRANASGSGLRNTTAVGMYPPGAAGCGAQDMSGNVWEWCLNEYENPANVQIGGAETRALHGGSWRSTPERARTASRNRSYPVNRTSNVGFRLAAGAPSPL